MTQPVSAIPDAAMRRFSYYLRALTSGLPDVGASVSSARLASLAGTTPATLRKDLSLVGARGRSGIGYDVATLVPVLERALGLDQRWRVAIIGAGHLGTALAGYSGLARQGFPVVAMLDTSREIIGSRVAGITVDDASALERVVRRESINMAVLTVPGAAAQAELDRLADVGVSSVLSFAPVALRVPSSVTLRRVDLASELSMLAHRTGHLQR